MRPSTRTTGLALLAAVGLSLFPAEAPARVRVVTSLPDLRALVEAVGGDLVEADSLARGTQNPHDIEVRPSLMLKLRRADLLVRNGAGGDPWVEPLLVGGQNARLFPGGPGYVDASAGVPIIAPGGAVDRSRGDVHPEGNPHFTLDPGTAPQVTANIVAGLARVDARNAAFFDRRRAEFLARLDEAMARWRARLLPFRGAPVVGYHETFTYLLRRFDLELAGAIEDRPGIPPSPAHLAALIQTMKQQKIRVVLTEPWADARAVERVARDSGARAVRLAPAVGGVMGTDTYVDLVEHNVNALAEAFR